MNHTRTPVRLLAAMLMALLGTACTHPYGMQAGPGHGSSIGPVNGPGNGPGHGPMFGQGYGPGYWGMGPGVMPGLPGAGRGYMGASGPGGLWGLERLDLNAEQRTQIARIQDEFAASHDTLLRSMHGQDGPPHGHMFDDSADRRSYERQAELQKQMFEAHLQARQRILAVLTPAQREQLGRGYGPR